VKVLFGGKMPKSITIFDRKSR